MYPGSQSSQAAEPGLEPEEPVSRTCTLTPVLAFPHCVNPWCPQNYRGSGSGGSGAMPPGSHPGSPPSGRVPSDKLLPSLCFSFLHCKTWIEMQGGFDEVREALCHAACT